eukprot:scaffold5380_cov131-Cylindrotheca_fusiformis.AAC.35
MVHFATWCSSRCANASHWEQSFASSAQSFCTLGEASRHSKSQCSVSFKMEHKCLYSTVTDPIK